MRLGNDSVGCILYTRGNVGCVVGIWVQFLLIYR